MNSVDCILRGNCQPLGGQSVWAIDQSAGPTEPIVLFAIPMDSRSDIYDKTNDQAGATLSIFLSALETFRTAQRQSPSSSQPIKRFMVAVFQGETWGRSGSRQWVSDVQQFQCEQEVSKEESPFNDKLCTSPMKVGSDGDE